MVGKKQGIRFGVENDCRPEFQVFLIKEVHQIWRALGFTHYEI